ncbi:hypothetical protein K432DRAFT_117780 [Lepidopterella palustris CBS 459.81]|uniref:Uncharacterized protein n=1 Tax=Lepidopterella palustris CBS 459.81 TaxID=1314670 RepID=A0A8E2E5B7_9PEZI|nr:hypothetical protein K432DRAFT_117780 [Lepidopterella palustris CBS 459.81]
MNGGRSHLCMGYVLYRNHLGPRFGCLRNGVGTGLADKLFHYDHPVGAVVCSPFPCCIEMVRPTVERPLEDNRACGSIKVDNSLGNCTSSSIWPNQDAIGPAKALGSESST